VSNNYPPPDETPAPPAPPRCAGCGRPLKRWRRRGLCPGCYADPEVRARHGRTGAVAPAAYDFLRKHHAAMTARELADALGVGDPDVVRWRLRQLGLWAKPDAGDERLGTPAQEEERRGRVPRYAALARSRRPLGLPGDAGDEISYVGLGMLLKNVLGVRRIREVLGWTG
jgi:hypothetical protein